MEKGKKLKLKRKIKENHVNKVPVNTNSKPSANIASNETIEAIDYVTLTSESDSEEPRHKEKKNNEPLTKQQPDPARNFLEVADPSLRKLREVIMKLSSDHNCSGKVNDFPPHICENSHKKVEDSEKIESTAALIHKRIDYDFPLLANGAELPPFPSMCDWCRRRRPSNDSCHSNNRKRRNSNSHVICDKTVDNNTAGNIKTNANLNGSTVSKVLSKYPCTSIKGVESESCKDKIHHNKGLETDVVSQECSSGVGETTSHNNSHLMRDRNSNFYSLQSRNNTQRHLGNRSLKLNHSTDQRNKHNSTSGIDICDADREIHNKLDSKPDKSTDPIEEDISTFNLAFDSDSDFDDINDIKEETTQVNKANKPNKTNIHSRHITFSKTGSKQSTQNHDCNSEMSSLPLLSNNQSKTGAHLTNQKQENQLKNQSKSATAVVRPMSRKEMVPHISEAPSTSFSVQGTSKPTKALPVQSCPLCQMKFKQSANQMEIDGHIAACLSAADDDVAW